MRSRTLVFTTSTSTAGTRPRPPARGTSRCTTIPRSDMASDARTWRSLVDEFRDVRAATCGFFRHLPAEAWTRRGIASGHPFSVRALAYICAGHVAHHARILRERYLQ